MIWSENELLDREALEKIQLDRLKKQAKRAYEGLEFYRQRMAQEKIEPKDIQSLEDLKNLPFTRKDDFRNQYPFGMFVVPMEDIVRTHASSGTTGKPTVVGYTEKDLDNWTKLTKRIAAAGGAEPGMTAQIAFGYGMFTGALGLHYALEHLPCNIVPSSSGNTKRQIMYLKDFQVDILVATPSYAYHIGEVAEDLGYNLQKDFSLKSFLLGGEGLSEHMREDLQEMWGPEVLITQNYGMSELNGPGVSGECFVQEGLHIQEDHFIPEIIDPDTEEVLSDGEEGELVISCLTKEAIPLLRYRTGDITRLVAEECECGRKTKRMLSLVGRSDDMMVIRGTNVFPTQIEEVLKEIDGIGPNYEIIVERENNRDELTVKVELEDGELLKSFKKLEGLRNLIGKKIQEQIGLKIIVEIHAPRSLKRFEGKSKRVIDLR